jgi:hypothetical protein
MDRPTYEALPKPVRATVEILAACPSKAKAQWIWNHLPQDWHGVVLAWQSDGDRAEVLEIEAVLRALP